ncbi:MAG: hypothetical protein H6737_31040 [Alphaproteobacteria bacterium]|nr:hypothetical protein [Alphaproteobacteria bacterium]
MSRTVLALSLVLPAIGCTRLSVDDGHPADCDPTSDPELDPELDPEVDPTPDLPLDAGGPGLLGVSLFQVVKVPLLEGGEAVLPDDREVPVVADRGARVVVYLDAPDGWSTAEVEARVEVTVGGVTTPYSASFLLDADSAMDVPETGLHIDLPAEAVQPDATYRVTLWRPGQENPSARFPASGEAALAAEATGPIRIHMVPYEVDGFVPDTSPAVIDGFRDAVMALYPTTSVEITVGTVRPWATNDLGDILVDVGVVQESIDQAPSDVYYYGLVSGVASRDDFQGVTGTSEDGGNGWPSRAYFAAGAAFGDALSESTLTHELGHMHGLEHAPCGSASNTDPDFPMTDGSIGTIGWDFRTDTFVEADTADVMGYCQPRWISAYHYALLAEQIQRSQGW